jgi:hypothetical protein
LTYIKEAERLAPEMGAAEALADRHRLLIVASVAVDEC